MRWKTLIKPPLHAPLPSWMIFPVIFAAVCASHFTLLRLPYYWDEAGYYIPAAWDFFRTSALIPFSTMTNAHPPLPSIYLALWWKLFSFLPEITRLAVVVAAAFALTAVWRLALRLTGIPAVAFWTILLTALYPVWFAQSTLAHADIFAAACTLWGLVYALPARDALTRQAVRPWFAALWFALAALSKETAIAIPLTLAVVSLIESHRAPGNARIRLWRESAWFAACVLPLAAWYGYHKIKTGFLFGNPEFLRYNAQANLAPFRIAAAFGYRILHLTAHMNLFVPVGIALAALLLEPRMDRIQRSVISDLKSAEISGAAVTTPEEFPSLIATGALVRIFALLLINALFFSVLGGALLTRYLLPMYPLVLLLAVTTLYRRAPNWQALTSLSALAFLLGLFVNPPYRFAPEDNLAYARVIRLHQAGIAQLEKCCNGSTVLTAWPVSDELLRPELGYLAQPFAVDRIEDFTAAQIARAAQEPEKYSAALVFSTKYDPPSLPLSLGPKGEAVDERYFGLHHDLPPQAIAAQLHGELLWQQQDQGQWIALIRFNRQFDARAYIGGRKTQSGGKRGF